MMTKLTLKEAVVWVEKVKAAMDDDDPEKAHALEDDLHVAVLQRVAQEPGELGELARVALGTLELEFPRWCA